MSRSTPSTLSRRQFFGLSLLAGVGGAGGARIGAQGGGGRDYASNIYTELLGVRPHLPAHDHVTVVGGSRMPDEVIRAMAEANKYFVDIHELNLAAGKRVAEVVGSEAALVTAGSFAGLLLGAAACLTGTDEEKMRALPHPTWPRRVCLTQDAHLFSYDRAYRAAGMELVSVKTREALARAIDDNTAMIAALARVEFQEADDPSVMTVEEMIDLGRRTGVPVLVDAASELPPIDTLTRYADLGADLVVISGGKGIRGPQSTGILAGRADLIEAARLQASPHSHIGRGMKVGKEEIVGFIAALNRYVELDHAAVIEGWNQKARYVAAQLAGIAGLTAEFDTNYKGYGQLELHWDQSVIRMTPDELRDELRAGEPRVAMLGTRCITRCMADGEEVLVAGRLREVFERRSRSAA